MKWGWSGLQDPGQLQVALRRGKRVIEALVLPHRSSPPEPTSLQNGGLKRTSLLPPWMSHLLSLLPVAGVRIPGSPSFDLRWWPQPVVLKLSSIRILFFIWSSATQTVGHCTLLGRASPRWRPRFGCHNSHRYPGSFKQLKLHFWLLHRNEVCFECKTRLLLASRRPQGRTGALQWERSFRVDKKGTIVLWNSTPQATPAASRLDFLKGLSKPLEEIHKAEIHKAISLYGD